MEPEPLSRLPDKTLPVCLGPRTEQRAKQVTLAPVFSAVEMQTALECLVASMGSLARFSLEGKAL